MYSFRMARQIQAQFAKAAHISGWPTFGQVDCDLALPSSGRAAGAKTGLLRISGWTVRQESQQESRCCLGCDQIPTARRCSCVRGPIQKPDWL
jgi:hypothetical protein